MLLSNRQSLIWIFICGLFFLLFCVIINCEYCQQNVNKKSNWLIFTTKVCLSIYELEEYSHKLEKRLNFPVLYPFESHVNYDELSTIYIITPTDSERVTQMADLVRMQNTLLLVPKIFWILVEDSLQKSYPVER